MSNEVKKDWITKAGLRAVVLFVNDSHHCGYVALEKDHPLYGVSYGEKHPALRWDLLEGAQTGDRGVFSLLKASLRDEGDTTTSPDVFFDVHGSITYASEGDDYPAKGDGLWWYGFDCAHAGDLTQRDLREGWKSEADGVFRDEAFCIAQCEKLAEQLEMVREVGARSAV